MLRRLYSLAADVAGPPLALAAALKGRFGGRWRAQLGLRLYPARLPHRPRLWFHGASVGEARSAGAVIRALLARRPDAEIFLSVGTPAGLKAAEDVFADERRVTVIAPPLDFWASPRRALSRMRPDALIILETELWPNLIYETRRAGVKLVLAAARLSERSFKRYRLVSGFTARMLESFDLIAPSGSKEAELYQALGAPPKRLKILGSPKFDNLLAEAQSPDFEARRLAWAEKLGRTDNAEPLIVAGSTHPGEEEILLAAFKNLEQPATLLIAPRHLGRTPEALKLAQSAGLEAALASGGGAASARVIVLDTVGQLPVLYALADAAIVGGSLRAGLAGHNPLEPAAVARPILFGPWMSSFAREAAGLLECGGAVEVQPETLATALNTILRDNEKKRRMGEAARASLAARPKAAPALAEAVLELLAADSPASE
ncbi:MAG: hypothetical protein LBV79_08695 [Candidatus Adiutrix sp.]|nr:hypothetical protein [Candidatus Adiutrix sp.]